MAEAPSSEQAGFARSRSLAERLDIYHAVYRRSGHPRRMMTDMFDGSGQAGFDAVMSRMTNSASFHEYFWIIHTMGLRGDVDVCDPRNFRLLNEKARAFHIVDPAHPVPIEFDGCVLPL